jgi:hypothetical protein
VTGVPMAAVATVPMAAVAVSGVAAVIPGTPPAVRMPGRLGGRSRRVLGVRRRMGSGHYRYPLRWRRPTGKRGGASAARPRIREPPITPADTSTPPFL